MRRTYGLIAALFLALLSISLASFAQAAPTRAVSKAIVRQVQASGLGSPYSMYNMTVNTTDGGPWSIASSGKGP